ncbi:MAG: hypothetical protein ACRCYK_00160, partial [Aeromonas hydrophila]
TLGLVVIAEGVETPDQADYLTAKGVNQLQGYLFGQPQPLATWVATLAVGAGLAPPLTTEGARRA